MTSSVLSSRFLHERADPSLSAAVNSFSAKPEATLSTLDRCWAKFERGREHLASLYREIRTALDAGVEFDRRWSGKAQGPSGAEYPVLEVFITKVPDIPIRSRVILGDALHNFRSVLDHLAWQLVIQNGATPTTQTQFPLASDPQRFKEQMYRLKGMHPDAVARIEALQPYDDREGPEFITWLRGQDLNLRPLGYEPAFPDQLRHMGWSQAT